MAGLVLADKPKPPPDKVDDKPHPKPPVPLRPLPRPPTSPPQKPGGKQI
jgi:hypothetical protein